MKKADGEVPAYPFDDLNPGISIRDYFAAKAMQAIIEKHPAVIESIDEVRTQRITAIGAYSYADAMLSERAKQ